MMLCSAIAAERPLGDLDNDGVFTVNDLYVQTAHMRGQRTLSETEATYADVNRDGVINDYDSEAIVRLILGTDQPASSLPLATVLETSPSAGESGISLTREFIVRFTMPLALNAVVTTHNPYTQTSGNLYAEFGGKKLLTRAELSSDRRKATLFFLEPLPASARVRVTFDPTGLRDLLGRELDLNGTGAAGAFATYDFDTLSITALSTVGVIGTVYGVEVGTSSSTKHPLAGVTITVDGAEQTLRTTTGSDGKFVLSPAPVGRFFVLVDGRTAGGSGGYYAFVGKAWEGIAGRLDTPATAATATNAAGDIYLPFIPTGTLQTVSSTQDTTVTFPATVLAANPSLAGVQITVPANSLFADNGTRGGLVGIAPVAPDKLPEPLPPGLNPALVITVQTNGATNFDRPVPVRFPNLPDPVTGEKLKPGEKSALWSFNHDTGLWEIAGAMTVNTDGSFVETDAGVGVRQPGWHIQQPGDQLKWPEKQRRMDECPEIGDAAPSLFDYGTTIAGCAAGFFNISDTTSLFIAATSSVNTLRNDFMQATKEYRAGRKTKAEFRSTLALLRLAAGTTQATVALINKGPENPLTQIRAAVDCTESLVGLAGGPCDVINNASPDCYSGFFRGACEKQSELKAKLALLSTALLAAQEGLSDVIFNAINRSLDAAMAALDADLISLKPQPQLALSVQITRSTELDASLDEVAFALDKMNGGLVGMENSKIVAHKSVAGYLSDVASAYVAHRGLPEHVYVLVEYTTKGDIRKLRTTSSGFFQIVLPPETPFRFFCYDGLSKQLGVCLGRTGPNGTSSHLPGPIFGSVSVSDSDADELSDEAERIIGTSSTNPDSDGDGVSDGAEVRNGTNPLDGLPATIGVIGGVDTPGVAIDVVAREGLAATAEGTGGVILFDASNPFQPTRIAAIDTPGTAMAVALEMPHLVVADGASGLAVIDVSDAPAAKIVRQVRLGAAARGVALGAGIAYVALENGQVVGVDVLTGAVLGRAQVANKRIDDVVLAGDYLYATAAGVVAVLNPRDGFPLMVRSVITSGSSSDRLRLSAGLDRLYETISSGAVILDITNPAQMSVLQTRTFAQLGWRQLVSANRSIGLAAAGAASPDDLQLYSLGTNGTDLTFSTSLATPGVTSAVSSYNGLAYLADGSAGLMVANYLAADIGTMKPTITFTASFPTDSTTASVEEGKRVRVTADARDDVQVRNVELLINGEITQSDGSFPYEFRFLTPRLSAGKTSFILQLRAYDTGGNATITDPLPITLTPDSTAPFLVRSAPDDGDIVGAISGTTLVFNEPLDPATVSWASVRLRATGPNHLFDDADDVVPSGVEVSYRVDSNTIVVATSAAFPPGVYRVDISNAVTDLAGNHLTDPLRRVFHVLDFADRDSDGVPDEVEALLGLDPDNNDTDGDGISDGREDFDLDGLSNAAEAALGTNPQAADTNGNGISDANEDPDQDGLNNKFEIARGTDPANPDTDGDGWNDETEVTGGSDPLSPASRPKLSFVASPEVLIAVPSTAGVMNAPLAAGVVIAAPPVMVALSSTAEVGIVPVVAGGFVAAPPLAISLPSTSDISDGAPANGTYVAAPPVAVALPVSSEVASVPPGTGTHVALPPVNIHLPTP